MIGSKIILSLVFLFGALKGYCVEHWVYIQPNNKYAVNAESDWGMSKKGDIVDIRPVRVDTVPSDVAKNSYIILKVNGLTDEQIKTYKDSWQTEEIINGELVTKGKAYRRNKIDVDALNLKKGIYKTTKDISIISSFIKQKTDLDLIYHKYRQKIYALTRPFRYAWHRIIYPYAFAAENISTINKTGEDYDTLTLWEAAKDGDLVTAQLQETAECYDDDGQLVDAFVINGSTTNSTYFMKVTVPSGERHDGIFGDGSSGNGFQIATTTAWAEVFDVIDSYFVVEWCEISVNVSTGIGIRLADSNTTIQNNIIKGFGSGAYNAGIYRASGSGFNIYNNIIYNFGDEGIFLVWNANHEVYNNTITDCASGIAHGSTDISTVSNNLFYGNTIDFDGTGTITGNYNFSQDATAPGANSIHGTNDSKTPDWVSDPSDLHLQSTSDAIDVGTDLTTSGNIDIDGRDRDAQGDTWDIGADEFVTAATTRRIIIVQ